MAKRSLEEEGNVFEKKAKIQQFRFGVLGPIKTRYRKKCVVYNMSDCAEALAEYNEGNDEGTGPLQWNILRRSIQKRMLEMDDEQNQEETEDFSGRTFRGELIHGDVLDFSGYRAIDCFIAFQEKQDFLLIPTRGEYGRIIPLEFSDAPIGFFYEAQSSLTYSLFDPHHTFPASWSEKLLSETPQQEVKKYEHPIALFSGILNSTVFVTDAMRYGYTGKNLIRWRNYYHEVMVEHREATCRKVAPLLAMVIRPLKLPQGVVQTIAAFLYDIDPTVFYRY